MGGEVEQILLLVSRLWKLGEILGINDDVAGRASHHALASAFKRFARRPRDIEQPLSRRPVHFLVERPVGLEKSHDGHASSFSCATAWAAIRLQASTSSVCVV